MWHVPGTVVGSMIDGSEDGTDSWTVIPRNEGGAAGDIIMTDSMRVASLKAYASYSK
jgi:hypothetical protein